jgi:hypothetical protein
MPTIKDKVRFTNAFKQGLVYLYTGRKISKKEALLFLEKNLSRSAKTIAFWGYANQEQQIDDEVLYGFAWLVMSNSDAPISWLEELFSPTTCMVLLPITSDWLLRCFSMAAHNANGSKNYQYPALADIEALIQRCFAPIPPVPSPHDQSLINQARNTLRSLEAQPDRNTPLAVMERYWDGLLREEMSLNNIDQHYAHLQNALVYALQQQQHAQQIDMTLLLLHYMDARWLMSERLTYVYSALKVIPQPPTSFDAAWLTAMLHIDGLGWILLGQENYAAAMPHIEIGLGIAEQIEPEPDTGYYDLTVLGKAYSALFHLYNTHDVAQAQSYLAEVQHLPCRAMVKNHYLRARLLLAAAKNDLSMADETYSAGLSLFYQNAAPIAKAGFFITAAEAFLRLGRFWKARVFLQASPVVSLGSDFSLSWYVEMKTISAQIALAEKKPRFACQELQDIFAVLEQKQKTQIKSRLLQNARRLYEEVKGYC